jgi:hypothetical protein
MITRGHLAAVLAAMLLSLCVVGAPGEAHAQDPRSAYLIRLLRTGSMFRVRAQAALSLGRVTGDPAVVRALSESLGDDHPAVRQASAASRERRGDPSALDALRRAANDREPSVRTAAGRAVRALERVARSRPRTAPVPTSPTIDDPGGGSTGPARFYVGLGVPGTKVSQLDRATLASARVFMESRIRALDGVVVAPENESRSAADRVIRSRRLAGYYLDSSIISVDQRPDGSVRASVSVIVQTYPGRDIRVMLQGAATVSGGGNMRQTAIEAALQGALRRLPQALEQSVARAGP